MTRQTDHDPRCARKEVGHGRIAPFRRLRRADGTHGRLIAPETRLIKGGRAELRTFFVGLGLARRDVDVVLRVRKREQSVTLSGDHYRFGGELAPGFPLVAFLVKWLHRSERPSDDRQVAPWTWSEYAWEDIFSAEDGKTRRHLLD